MYDSGVGDLRGRDHKTMCTPNPSHCYCNVSQLYGNVFSDNPTYLTWLETSFVNETSIPAVFTTDDLALDVLTVFKKIFSISNNLIIDKMLLASELGETILFADIGDAIFPGPYPKDLADVQARTIFADYRYIIEFARKLNLNGLREFEEWVTEAMLPVVNMIRRRLNYDNLMYTTSYASAIDFYNEKVECMDQLYLKSNEVAEKTEEIESLKREITSHEAKATSQENKLTTLKEELNKTVTSFMDKTVSQEMELVSLRSELDKSKQEIDELKELSNSQETEIKRLKLELANSISKYSSLTRLYNKKIKLNGILL